jgi:hypothetical protein
VNSEAQIGWAWAAWVSITLGLAGMGQVQRKPKIIGLGLVNRSTGPNLFFFFSLTFPFVFFSFFCAFSSSLVSFHSAVTFLLFVSSFFSFFLLAQQLSFLFFPFLSHLSVSSFLLQNRRQLGCWGLDAGAESGAALVRDGGAGLGSGVGAGCGGNGGLGSSGEMCAAAA